LTSATRALSVVALAGVIAIGLAGRVIPTLANPLQNAAVLVVWVGWWAGYVATVYLVGNSWPALNPWRALADWLPSLERPYPDDLGAWPSVVGLLALVWLEVVSPLADQPYLLALVVLGYTAVTLAGAFVFGSETWFDRVDPIARVFRYYGAVAPIHRDEDGLQLRLPGSALTDPDLVDGRDEVAFVVALLWVTTYDGFVGTPVWRDLARAVVGAGVPAELLYPAAMLLGFGVFLGAYRLAARYARDTAETYLTSAALARRFAGSLLPIAAGYHLAHFLGYFVSLSPVLVGVLTNPLSPPANPVVIVLPGWFGGVSVAAVLLGHLLAVWVAHASAYDAFPGRLQAVRSQYPLVVVMVLYTMSSLWIVSAPNVVPPYV
ncbi:hypothetical protein, partial [Halorussus sp. GCM10023401]